MQIEDTALRGRLENGWTIPPAWYTDPGRYERELSAVFGHVWQYAGPVSHASVVGDFFTCTIGRMPVVVTRHRDESLRAHLNVCRHRFCAVAKGRGNRKSLQCPYHAWTYGLDGRLIGAPRSDREPSFDRDELSLIPARVDTWGPMVFVCLDPEAPRLADWLGEIPALYERTGLRVADLRWRARREYHMRVNWKTAVENILECYHCPTVHPSYADVMDLQNYDLRVADHYSIQATRLRDDADSGYDTSGSVEDGLYAFLWPNFMANVNPGAGHFHTNFAFAIGPQEVVMVNDFFFVDEVDEHEATSYIDFQNTVSIEDIEPVESVQVGIASGALRSGRLLLNSELLIQHFQRLVLDALPDGAV